MTLTSEQLNDYKERCLSFLKITRDCLPILTQTGVAINNFYKGKDAPRYMVYCHDMIKRIRENLFFLTQFPPQEHNSIPLRLILRSIFNDLISLSYVVENIDDLDTLSHFLNLNDIKAIEGKNNFAECEKEFLELCGKKNWDGFLDSAMADFKQVKDEILSPYGSKGNLKKCTKPETKEIADYFKKDPKLNPLYALLFGPFKMLSQVEHYANENRSYSFFDKNTAFFFHKFAIHYQKVIPILCNTITQHIDTLIDHTYKQS